MNLTYVIDYVFCGTPDGRVWTDTSYDASFWLPYVQVYGTVTLLCRVQDVARASAGWREVTGQGVAVAALPLFRGALQYLRVAGEIKQRIRTVLAGADGVILRMPSNLARCAAKELRRTGRRYAVEVVGDPYEALAPGVVQMAGRPLFRWMFTKAQKEACASATGVAYVAAVLRRRYPARTGSPTLVCSDVRLDRTWLLQAPRLYEPRLEHHLLTVATLSQMYKGIDVLLRAVKICRERRCAVSLTVVGTGKYRAELERLAETLGITGCVRFVGVVAWGPALLRRLDEADVFVLPSRVEAMPRALLEAMARGLPAIATNVGAVHEVLDAGRMVPAGDAVALAHQIIHLTLQARRLEAASARNLSKAHEFAAELLQPRWADFQREMLHEFALEALPAGLEVREPVAV